MKNILLAIAFLFTISLTYSQSEKVIASAYIKRANEAIETSVDFKSALTSFNKAMKYMDTITDRKIAMLGSKIYFEIHQKQGDLKNQLEFLNKSKEYCDQYFALFKNNTSEEYINSTEHSILVRETLAELKLRIEEEEKEIRKKELELKRIDSLKTLWATKSKKLTISVDSIYSFNKNNYALYTKEGSFGVINDLGEIIVEANEYKDALSFDGYIILKNKASEPTKLYCFNSKENSGYQLPSIYDFNTLSTHYGEVMMPRGNGRLVTYPNNSNQPFVYDLNVKSPVGIANKAELLKNLKKSDVIDKYNRDEQVKIGGTWYDFGNHLGGGVHPLYLEGNNNVDCYLFTANGKREFTANSFKNLGSFYNGKLQAVTGNQVVWINQEGVKVSNAKDEAIKYDGSSTVKRLEDGTYQIVRNGIITLGEETLEKMPDFLRKFSKSE
jgi:hypothetical protein